MQHPAHAKLGIHSIISQSQIGSQVTKKELLALEMLGLEHKRVI
jgi:hypothetical protein